MLLSVDSMGMVPNVTESGPSNGGASQDTEGPIVDTYFNIIIGAVITALVLVFICLLFVLFRYMYRHKGTYHTNEAKGSEFADSADAALQGDPALQESMDDSKKEYFI